ncbi:MAG: sulfur carrier protein ThiS [Hyphomicrobium sp.]|jgi:sulfur carrier protein|nr:sulfur carrier protein ThiS [Hyphomicrobium sp.]
MRATPIALTVNGAPRETFAETLAELVASEELGQVRIATAVNGAFVAARVRGEHRLQAGDRVEIVSARQGG